MASPTQDEGFHEIQLNGKQLVFLFMAATVVSVVIFLCGVLVGRGVRVERAIATDPSPANAVAETTPTQPPVAPAPAPAGSDPTAAPPPTPGADDLSYFNRLEKSKVPAEDLKAGAKPEKKSPEKTSPVKTPPEKTPPAMSAPAPAPVPTPAAAPGSVDNGEPSGQGFAVQIAALNVRSEAEAIAKRLTSKGYAAYVLTPPKGTPSVFRVRVGKFSTRREADTVASKLQKEEQFKPWVTR